MTLSEWLKLADEVIEDEEDMVRVISASLGWLSERDRAGSETVPVELVERVTV